MAENSCCATCAYIVKSDAGYYCAGTGRLRIEKPDTTKCWEYEKKGAAPQVCKQKKELVLEFKENNGETEVDVKIGNLTPQDICYAQGALLKKISEKYYGNDLDKLLFKLQAVHDICITLDLAPVAKSIKNAIKQYGLC